VFLYNSTEYGYIYAHLSVRTLLLNFLNEEEKMLNNKNEIVSVLPIQNVNGGYVQKTYAELIEEISPDEIDKLYSYFEQFTENNVSKNAELVGNNVDE